jgi:hypothetical protein
VPWGLQMARFSRSVLFVFLTSISATSALCHDRSGDAGTLPGPLNPRTPIAANENTGPKILNLDPPIQIQNQPGSGIVISDFKLNLNSESITGGTFQVRNTSAKALVAFSITTDFYPDSTGGKPWHGGNTEDAWFMNETILQPGEQKQVSFNTSISPTEPIHLKRVLTHLEYAEFSDGSTKGDNVSEAAAEFAVSRKAKEAVREQFAQLLRSGTPSALVIEEIGSALAADPKPSVRRLALIQMQMAADRLGQQEFADRLVQPPLVPLR